MAGLFGGVVPPSLTDRYSLQTEAISHLQAYDPLAIGDSDE